VAISFDPESETRAKQVLFRCMEELQATKAALYLIGPEGAFELITQYGFGKRDALAAEIKASQPLWDFIRRHRTVPAFVNNAHEAPDLAPILESAGTARLLTIPITLADHLVGLVDVRDKARKAPFGPSDIEGAKRIGQAVVQLLVDLGMFGAQAPPREASAPVAAVPAVLEAAGNLPHRATIEELVGWLRVAARLPAVSALVLTVTDGRMARALVLRGVALDERQRAALAAHQAQCCDQAGLTLPPPANWGWQEEDSGGGAGTSEEIRTGVLATAPVGVVVSVLSPAGAGSGEPIITATRRQFELLRQLRACRRAMRNLARTLLEPGESTYPHLRQHSQAVSELAQRFAAALGLSEEEEELVTIAAFLHDVGMRELDYQRLYRLERPTDLDRRQYQRHCTIGARIVEGSEYPGDLAAAIRHHHERWDGGGYPNRIAGRNIPLASRIIHLAEVYDVLTSPSSYRRAVSRTAALETIHGEAGKQFDPELVPLLADLIRP